MAVSLLDTNPFGSRKAVLEQQYEDLTSQLDQVMDQLTELPEVWLEQPASQGAVIRFRKYQQAYWFAAIHIGDLWYVTQDGSRTSRQGHEPRDWEDLLEWIGERNFATVEVLS